MAMWMWKNDVHTKMITVGNLAHVFVRIVSI